MRKYPVTIYKLFVDIVAKFRLGFVAIFGAATIALIFNSSTPLIYQKLINNISAAIPMRNYREPLILIILLASVYIGRSVFRLLSGILLTSPT